MRWFVLVSKANNEKKEVERPPFLFAFLYLIYSTKEYWNTIHRGKQEIGWKKHDVLDFQSKLDDMERTLEFLFPNKDEGKKRLEKTLVSFSFARLKAIEGSVTAGFPQKNIANKNNRNPFFDKNSGFIF